MFERFTDSARNVVVQAQEAARRLGHNHIGCEHLLLAAAMVDEPAGAILRDHGITPERIEAEILRGIGRGYAADPVDPLRDLDHEALAAIGIDLDEVRARLEAAFGPDALARAITAHRRATLPGRRRRRPVWGKGPVAHLKRSRRARREVPPSPELRAMASRAPDPAIRGHIPFTPRAKKSLELSLRESKALHDNYIGVQHLILALLHPRLDGMSPTILSALDASSESVS